MFRSGIQDLFEPPRPRGFGSFRELEAVLSQCSGLSGGDRVLCSRGFGFSEELELLRSRCFWLSAEIG